MSNQKSRESFLVHVMNNGFSRAAASFSRFMGNNVKISTIQAGIAKHNDLPITPDGKGDIYILITQIIGELSGKSYFIFNEDQSNNLAMLAGHSSSVHVDEPMKEALLTEIDNIISAAVISELSEALQMEIYGDVPILKRIPQAALREFIDKENQHADAAGSLISSTVFQFNVDKHIHPQFLWKLSEKVFDMIPSERLITR